MRADYTARTFTGPGADEAFRSLADRINAHGTADMTIGGEPQRVTLSDDGTERVQYQNWLVAHGPDSVKLVARSNPAVALLNRVAPCT